MTVETTNRLESNFDPGLGCVVWGLALTPTASLFLICSLVLRARLALGRWPSIYDPDPKDLGALHHLVAAYSVVAAFLSVPLLLLVALLAWYRQPKMGWQLGLAFVLCVGVVAGSIYLYRLDPGGFTAWFMD